MATATYRPDFDGLRGISILGVMLFQANPAWLGACYLAVDVFFVISGFLITSIDLFCDAARCFGQKDGTPYCNDDDHLLSAGARIVVEKCLEALR